MAVKDEEKNFTKASDDKPINETSADSDNARQINDSSLEALVNQERSDARERLREELGREPTPEEADEWLSAHTEGY